MMSDSVVSFVCHTVCARHATPLKAQASVLSLDHLPARGPRLRVYLRVSLRHAYAEREGSERTGVAVFSGDL